MTDTGVVIKSVKDVANAGFGLSLLLNAIACEVASAGVEVHSISSSVTFFSSMLKQVATLLQAQDSVHTPEAVADVKQISEECTLVFNEIRDMLDRATAKKQDSSVGPTVAQRFKWCFKKGRVQYLLGQLDTLKLSLSVVLQILQLGTIMASTSRHDPPETVKEKKGAIAQERAEAQNMVLVRYWQMSSMEHLYEAARREEEEFKQAAIEEAGSQLLEDGQKTQLLIEAPPEYRPSNELAKLPVFSFGDLDHNLHQIRRNNMVQESDKVIDPLLDRWTNWHEVREKRHQRLSSSGIGRISPSVELSQEDEEEDKPLHQKYSEREESPKGLYLEGETTDWRKPHSSKARREATLLRQKYSGYQPSVSAESSDQEDAPKPKNRGPRHHILDSSTESSDEEPVVAQRRRRSSGSPTIEKKTRFSDGTPTSHSYGLPQSGFEQNNARSPGGIPQATPRTSTSAQKYTPSNKRPAPTPNQDPYHHSVSSPLPPIHTSNGINPYGLNPPYSPHAHLHTPYMGGQAYLPVPRYMPPQANRMTVPGPGRPVSQDGIKARSPSRIPAEYGSYNNPRGQARSDDGINEYNSRSRRSGPKSEQERKAAREKTKKSLTEGATKGLLGGGAIGLFLEALEGLTL